MKTHELKTWPDEFTATILGNKTFEVRVDDRHFKNGDYLRLREWDPKTRRYTGQSLLGQITYILSGPNFDVPPNMVIMSVEPVRAIDLPRLGCATTGQLLEELKARCEVDGTINYRTVDAQ